MVDLSRIDPMIDIERSTCRVVVETPRGSRTKYTYDSGIEAFELSGILPAGMSFPLNFGFIPSTLGGDDDPLDVLLICDEPAAVGAVVHARILGVIEAEQTERNGTTVRNDRLVARADLSISYEHTRTIRDLEPRFVEHLGQFFVNYNRLKGKVFRVLRDGDAAHAMHLIVQAASAPYRDVVSGRTLSTNG